VPAGCALADVVANQDVGDGADFAGAAVFAAAPVAKNAASIDTTSHVIAGAQALERCDTGRITDQRCAQSALGFEASFSFGALTRCEMKSL